MITVGIPAWRVKNIMWLPLESLCRQQTDQHWELIILEERHEGECGFNYFTPYFERLEKAGCVDFTYTTRDKKMSLAQKWALLGRMSRRESSVFCICDGDNYYQNQMFEDVWEAISVDGHDWITTKKGYWYNIQDGTFVEYNKPKSPTGLQMSISSGIMRNLPDADVHRLLNRWVYMNAGVKNPVDHPNENTLCTHGCGNISGSRRAQMMKDYTPPFYKTDKVLEDIVPLDIAKRLKEMK